MVKTTTIVFVAAFLATSAILAYQSSTAPQYEPGQAVAPSTMNADPQQTRMLQTAVPPGSPDFRHATPASPPKEPSQEAAPSRDGAGMLNASDADYCPSEQVRLNAMRALLNQRSKVQVHNFNLRLDRFKIRCANFPRGDSDASGVKQLGDARRSQLISEAISIMSRWRR